MGIRERTFGNQFCPSLSSGTQTQDIQACVANAVYLLSHLTSRFPDFLQIKQTHTHKTNRPTTTLSTLIHPFHLSPTVYFHLRKHFPLPENLDSSTRSIRFSHQGAHTKRTRKIVKTAQPVKAGRGRTLPRNNAVRWFVIFAFFF